MAIIQWTIGVTLTLLGVIFAVINYRRQTKTKIFFIEHKLINLYDDLVRHIPNLAVTYNGEEVTKTMFLLRGIFVCSGNKDISKNDIEKGLLISLKSPSSKWLDYKVINKTSNLDVHTTASAENIEFKMPLFRNNDYFVIECLAESENTKFILDHRIANVPTIKKTNVSASNGIIFRFIIGLIILGFSIPMLKNGNPFQKIDALYFEPQNQMSRAKYYTQTDSVNNIFKNYSRYCDSLNLIIDKMSTSNSLDSLHIAKSLIDKLDSVNTNKLKSLLSYQDSLKKVNTLIDSATTVAANEYTVLQGLFHTNTRNYLIDRRNSVYFKIKNLPMFIYLYPAIQFIISIIIILSSIREYLRYRRVLKLARSVLFSKI